MSKNRKIEMDLKINENSTIYNEFNEEQLSEELAQYIESSCKGQPTERAILIKIFHEHEMPETDKRDLVDAIRANFGIDAKEKIMQLEKARVKNLTLFLVGLLALIITAVFTGELFYFMNELITVLSWIMLWEAVYGIIFETNQIIADKQRSIQLSKCKVRFVKLGEKTN